MLNLGRPPLVYDRDLTEEDLARNAAATNNSLNLVKKFRQRHHAFARMLAQGVKIPEAALAAGYERGTAYALVSDPTFQELVVSYRAGIDKIQETAAEAMAALNHDAIEIMRERLEADDSKVGFSELREIIKMSADRSGLGPRTTQDVNVNVGLAARLESARKRIAARTIEGEVVK